VSQENAELIIALFIQMSKDFFTLTPHAFLVKLPEHVETQVVKVINKAIQQFM
jgi:hypothetical protein